MKKFDAPEMFLQRLDVEDVMSTSTCFEVNACDDCYCTSVDCDPVYECDGLVCGTLSDYD